MSWAATFLRVTSLLVLRMLLPKETIVYQRLMTSYVFKPLTVVFILCTVTRVEAIAVYQAKHAGKTIFQTLVELSGESLKR